LSAALENAARAGNWEQAEGVIPRLHDAMTSVAAYINRQD
jgi:hypothetical protein